jgi:hypothetical protein
MLLQASFIDSGPSFTDIPTFNVSQCLLDPMACADPNPVVGQTAVQAEGETQMKPRVKSAGFGRGTNVVIVLVALALVAATGTALSRANR